MTNGLDGVLEEHEYTKKWPHPPIMLQVFVGMKDRYSTIIFLSEVCKS